MEEDLVLRTSWLASSSRKNPRRQSWMVDSIKQKVVNEMLV